VTIRGVFSVAAVEWAKLRAQTTMRATLVVCVAAPFVFAIAMRVQSSVPSDTLFGRAVTESGFATSLVVLGFAGLWVLPILTSIVGGDCFAAEDRYGTWSTILTRSRGRTDVFAGKLLAALACSTLAVAALGASSLAAGVLIVGKQPLIDLSGAVLPAPAALVGVILAWASVVPPSLAFAAMAVLLSVLTRSTTAGIGLPVVVGLVMQLFAFVDGPELPRRLLLTSSFAAWHGLLNEHPYFGPLVDGTIVSAAYALICVLVAYRIFLRRDAAA
jgi:ABC-2 type transport system permease protein